MSEKPEDDAQPDAPEGGGGDDAQSEVARLRAELVKARKWEERAKQNADAAKRLAEIEDAKKSEVEKAAEAQKAAEAKSKAVELELAKLRVAMRKGLTESQAKRLVGETEEDLEADADELLATFTPPKDDDAENPPSDTSSQRQRPRERLRPGGAPPKDPQPSAKDIVDKVVASKSL